MQDTFAPGEVGPTAAYPVRLTMAYPEELSRLSTFFRVVLALPVIFFLYLFQGSIVAAMWAAILVSGRAPRWLFDFQVGFNRFSTRAGAYFLLLTDKYPAFEGEWVVQYEVDYPERLSRWKLLFWKILTAIPHIVVLAFLYVAVAFVVFIGWFGILFTGHFPRGLHLFVVGVLRWSARVTAYVESLTDEFPPFSLDEHAGPGGAQALAAVIGGAVAALAIGGGIAGGVVFYQYDNEAKTNVVDYEDAQDGTLSRSDALISLDNVRFTLELMVDDASIDILQAPRGSRLVVATVSFDDQRKGDGLGWDIDLGTLRLETDGDDSIRPVLITADGIVTPIDVIPGDSVVLSAYFEVDNSDDVIELRGYPDNSSGRHVAWEFE